MIIHLEKQRPTLAYRILCAFIVLTFSFSVIAPPTPVYAQLFPQGLANLPLPGTMVPVSPGFTPPMVTGITIHPENPLEFDFIIGSGDDRLQGKAFEDESTRLIKYFLAALTVPEKEMWVNLSPYEKDRIIPQGFGDTEMGRDLLAQDYILKQLTASLMYPEDELGDQFWQKVRTKAYEKFGTTEIPMNTFNKVWIVPDEAIVYEHGKSAFVVKSHLKVMLEEDYQALAINVGNGHARSVQDNAKIISGVSSEVIREVLIPEIEKEVNEGETFANLRQIYNSVILATWYKQNLKDSLLGQVYVGQNKTAGVDTQDKQANQKIYDQYVEAFKKGVYNYIREDYDPTTQEIIPRKYFSGGADLTNLALEGVIRLLHSDKDGKAGELTRNEMKMVGDFLTQDYDESIVNVNLVEVSTRFNLKFNGDNDLIREKIDEARGVTASSPVNEESLLLKIDPSKSQYFISYADRMTRIYGARANKMQTISSIPFGHEASMDHMVAVIQPAVDALIEEKADLPESINEELKTIQVTKKDTYIQIVTKKNIPSENKAGDQFRKELRDRIETVLIENGLLFDGLMVDLQGKKGAYVLNKEATKPGAIRNLMQQKNLSPDQIAYFGDQFGGGQTADLKVADTGVVCYNVGINPAGDARVIDAPAHDEKDSPAETLKFLDQIIQDIKENKTDIKAVMLDIGGTIVVDKERPQQAIIDAMAELANLGIYVGVVSAKTEKDIKEWIDTQAEDTKASSPVESADRLEQLVERVVPVMELGLSKAYDDFQKKYTRAAEGGLSELFTFVNNFSKEALPDEYEHIANTLNEIREKLLISSRNIPDNFGEVWIDLVSDIQVLVSQVEQVTKPRMRVQWSFDALEIGDRMSFFPIISFAKETGNAPYVYHAGKVYDAVVTNIDLEQGTVELLFGKKPYDRRGTFNKDELGTILRFSSTAASSPVRRPILFEQPVVEISRASTGRYRITARKAKEKGKVQILLEDLNSAVEPANFLLPREQDGKFLTYEGLAGAAISILDVNLNKNRDFTELEDPTSNLAKLSGALEKRMSSSAASSPVEKSDKGIQVGFRILTKGDQINFVPEKSFSRTTGTAPYVYYEGKSYKAIVSEIDHQNDTVKLTFGSEPYERTGTFQKDELGEISLVTSSPVTEEIIKEGKRRLNAFGDQVISETNEALEGVVKAVESVFSEDVKIISDPTVFTSNKAAPMPIVMHQNKDGEVVPMHLDGANNFVISEFDGQQGTVIAASLPLGVRLVNLTLEVDSKYANAETMIENIKRRLKSSNIDVRPLDATAGFLLEDEIVVDETGISVLPYENGTRVNLYVWYRTDKKVSMVPPLTDLPLEVVEGSLRQGSRVARPKQARTKKLIINGARGRIGSLTAMQLLRDVDWNEIELVGAFGTDAKSFANLLKVESVHGQTLFKKDSVSVGKDEIGDYVEVTIAGKGTKRIHTFNIRAPKGTDSKSAEMIPVEEFKQAFDKLGGVDIVIDATEPIKTRDQFKQYIKAGAKKVIKTAPSKEGADGVKATPIVVGVNHDNIPANEDVFDQASCTTGSTGSVYKAILDAFNADLLAGDLTSAHSSTGTNKIVDAQTREGKNTTALLNVIKATTGAAKALGPIIPAVIKKIFANALRIPLANGSLTVSKLTLKLPEGVKLTADMVNEKLRELSKTVHFNGVFSVGDTELSAAQIIGRSESAIVFAPGTRVQKLDSDNTYLVTILTWYDNEWGYTNRPIDLAHFLGVQIDQEEAETASSPIAEGKVAALTQKFDVEFKADIDDARATEDYEALQDIIHFGILEIFNETDPDLESYLVEALMIKGISAQEALENYDEASSPVKIEETIAEGKRRLDAFADQAINETNEALKGVVKAVESVFSEDVTIISDPTVFTSNKAAPMPIVMHKNKNGEVVPMYLDGANNFVISEFDGQQGTVIAASLPLGVRLVNLTLEVDSKYANAETMIEEIKRKLKLSNIDVRPLDATAGFLMEDKIVVDETGISVLPYENGTRVNLYIWYRTDAKVSIVPPLTDLPLEMVEGSLRQGSRVARPKQARTKKLIINGARGRIGSLTAMQLLRDVDWNEIDLVGAFGIGMPGGPQSFANLLKIESVHGQTLFKEDSVSVGKDEIGDFVEVTIAGKGTKRIHTFNIRAPKGTDPKSAEMIPVEEFKQAFDKLGGVDIVIDATEPIKTKDQFEQYIKAGAKKVIKTAPSKEGADGIKATPVVTGVNHDQIPSDTNVFDNASCTTGSTGSVYLAILKAFNAELLAGDLTSAHSATGSNVPVDSKDRSGKKTSLLLNAIKTTTGAAEALGPIIPELQDKFFANAVRLPLADGSMTVSKLTLKIPEGVELTADMVNEKLRELSKTAHFNGVFSVGEIELSAAQIIGRSESAIVFAPGTRVQKLDSDNTYLVTLLTWYDNEWGYTNRPIDLAHFLGVQIDAEEKSIASSPIKVKASITEATGGAETLRVDAMLADGSKGHFVVPAGTSSGEDERQTEANISTVILNVGRIISEVSWQGLRPDQLEEIGQLMLKMDEEKFLGAQAMLGYQMALAHAVAASKGKSLYELIWEIAPDLAPQVKDKVKTVIQYNVTNGGAHADNDLDMQEFMVVPIGETVADNNRMADKIDLELGLIYQALGLSADPYDQGEGKLRGKEGGYRIEDLTFEKLAEIYANASKYAQNEKLKSLNLERLKNENIGIHEFVLNALAAAVKNSGYELSTSGQVGTVSLAIDPAVSEMYVTQEKIDEGVEYAGRKVTQADVGKYMFEGKLITSNQLTTILKGWAEKYQLDSMEDIKDQNDWDGWMDVIDQVGDHVLVIGDDVLVTQAGRLMKFIEKLKERGFIGENGKVTKRIGILIKLNQNGFLTTGINNPDEGYLGTLEVIRLAAKYGIVAVISHRSKEAGAKDNEVSIADLAAGVGAYALKSGDHVQPTRAVKEDRLAAIDSELRSASSPVELKRPDIKRIGILFGGGLASGHNPLLRAVVHEAERQSLLYGEKVVIVPLFKGWASLINDDLVQESKKVGSLDVEDMDEYIRTRGGAILKSSRTNPFSEENIKRGVPQTVMDHIKELKLDALITAGGDDTNGASARLQAMYPEFPVLGVPKTMDNDIVLPEGVPTYGYDTFVQEGIRTANLYKTSAIDQERIFVVEVFGRDAGFTALGIGAGIRATRTLIPEEGPIDFHQLIKELKEFYYDENHKYGIVIVSEGVQIRKDNTNAHLFEEGFRKSPVAKAAFERTDLKRDEFGHPKLKDAGRIIAAILNAQFPDVNVTLPGKIDYAAREANVSEADLKMTEAIGTEAVKILREKGSHGSLLYVNKQGIVQEMSLQEKLGGRVADIEPHGADFEMYVAANRSLFPLRDQYIDILNISSEIVQKLKKENIFFVNELLEKTVQDLEGINELDKNDIREIRVALRTIDYSLKSASSPVSEESKQVGGINLNPELLDLQIKRDGNGIPLPINLQPIHQMRIDGFVPIIINVTPVVNMPLLLGFADTDFPVNSANANAKTSTFDLSLIDKYRNKYILGAKTEEDEIDV